MLNLSDSVDHNTNVPASLIQNYQQNLQLQTQATNNTNQSFINNGNNPNNLSQISDRPSNVSGQNMNSQPQSSSLVKQLSEKVRSQAERLQKLETYKQLCERRLQEIDPKHPIPVLPQHLGQKSFSQPQPELPPSAAEMKRQLAIKEQDLQYAKQRNEKLINFCSSIIFQQMFKLQI